jgi:hypothetical protein
VQSDGRLKWALQLVNGCCVDDSMRRSLLKSKQACMMLDDPRQGGPIFDFGPRPDH